MSAFIISYDLKSSDRDYSSFYDEIKSLGDWQHPLETVWVVFAKIRSGMTMQQFLDDTSRRLRDEMARNDLLLLFEIKPENRQGWAATSFWQWIKEKTGEK